MRAINRAGLISEPAQSTGFTVDLSAPVGGQVNVSHDTRLTVLDGAEQDSDQLLSASADTMTATWHSFSDPDYGEIVEYRVGVGDCAAAATSIPLESVGLNQSYTFKLARDADGLCTHMPSASQCRFEHMNTYCTFVSARNLHGGWSYPVRSSGVRVCLQPPTIGFVSDGLGTSMSAVTGLVRSTAHSADSETDATSTAFLDVGWGGFDDECAFGVETFTLTLERRVNATRGQPPSEYVWLDERVEVFDRPSHTLMAVDETLEYSHRLSERLWPGDVELPEGEYRSRVCATSVLGLTSCAISDGVIVDRTPPTDGEVCVQPFAGPLRCGGRTHGWDQAPVLGTVHVWVGAEAAEAASLLTLRWRGFSDAESGVWRFEWAVGSWPIDPRFEHISHYQKNVAERLAWRSNGARPTVSLTRDEAASIAGVSRVYVNVICTNGAGMMSGASLSLVVDATLPELIADPTGRSGSLFFPSLAHSSAPLLSTVHNGVLYLAQADQVNETTGIQSVQICRELSRVTDPESGLASVTMEGWFGRESRLDCVNLTVSEGAEYHVSLVAVNGAGGSSRASLRFIVEPRPVDAIGAVGTMVVCTASRVPQSFHATDASTSASSELHLCFDGYSGQIAGHEMRLKRLACSENSLSLQPPQGRIDETEHAAAQHSTDHPLRCPGMRLDEVSIGRTLALPHSSQLLLAIFETPLTCGHTYTVEATPLSYAGVASGTMKASVVIDCSPPIGGDVTFSRGWLPIEMMQNVSGADLLAPDFAWPDKPNSCVTVGTRVWANLTAAHAFGFHDAESGLRDFIISYARENASDAHSGYEDVAAPALPTSTSVIGGAMEQDGPVALGEQALSIGLQRLVSLDTRNATLPGAARLVVAACNRAGLCGHTITRYLMVCPPQPPMEGSAFITSPENVTIGFITNRTALHGGWSGFVDDCASDRNPLSYDVCVGSTPYGCQAISMASHSSHVSALSDSLFAWSHEDLQLRCGHAYHLTVRATNCAGLSRTIASPPVTLCCEGVRAGIVSVRTAANKLVTFARRTEELHLVWSGFDDPCAGVRTMTVTLFREEFRRVPYAVATWQIEEPLPSSSLRISASGSALPQGRFHCRLTATSHAGYVTNVDTATFIVDETPPTGARPPRVRWRTSPNDWQLATGRDICVPASASFLEVAWTNADALSGVRNRSFAMVLYDGNATNATNATAATNSSDGAAGLDWRHMGLQTLVRVPIGEFPSSGRAVRFVARACDYVGMCTTTPWSRSIRVLAAEPSGGSVSLTTAANATGAFLNDPTSLRGSWANFTVSGCPSTCGAAHEKCYFDATCSSTPPRRDGAGCNAGGIGRNCRFCGFASHPPCPASYGEPAAWTSINSSATSDDAYSTLSFEVCLGTTPHGCQLQSFERAGAVKVPRSDEVAPETTWEAHGLDLMCGSTYYLTVLAANCAGRERVVASTGATLCCMGPTMGTLIIEAPTVTEPNTSASSLPAAGQPYALQVSWNGFTDGCSGLEAYSIHIWTVNADESSIEVLLNLTAIAPNQTSLALELPFPTHVLTVQAEITAVGRSGLISAPAFASHLIDPTPPLPGVVNVTWSSRATWASLSQLSPAALCVPTEATSLQLYAQGIVDAETEVSAIEWVLLDAAGEAVNTWDSLSRVLLVPIANLTSNASGGSVSAPSLLRFYARSCNRFGACAASPPSMPIVLPRGPPTVGDVRLAAFNCSEDDGPGLGNCSFDGQLSSTSRSLGFVRDPGSQLAASWSGFAVSIGELAFTGCLGTTPGGCQVLGPVDVADQVADSSQSTATSDWLWQTVRHVPPLLCEHSYFMTIRAVDCAGQSATSVSNGIKVCCQLPRIEGLELRVRGASGWLPQQDVIHPGWHDLQLSWTLLDEVCSGIRHVEVSLVNADSGAVHASWSDVAPDASNARNWSAVARSRLAALPATVLDTLADGTRFYAHLKATSHAGHVAVASTAVSRVDVSPPVPGTVLDESDAGFVDGILQRYTLCAASRDHVIVSWDGFTDASSALVSVEVGLGLQANVPDLLPYSIIQRAESAHFGLMGSGSMAVPLELLPAAAGDTIFAFVRVTDAVGLTANSSAVRGVRVLEDAGRLVACV